jgi:hypothetical protein
MPLIASAHDETFKGRYSWGVEVDSFSPCQSNKSFWVSHGWGSAHANLNQFYREKTTEPYQFIYLEFRGHYHEELEDGFDAAYDGTIHISEIFKKDDKIPSDCQKNS